MFCAMLSFKQELKGSIKTKKIMLIIFESLPKPFKANLIS